MDGWRKLMVPAWLFGCMTVPSVVFSQTVGGKVINERGATVPLARVALLSFDKGGTRETLTDASGQFTITGLSPGKYMVDLSGAGLEGWQAGPLVFERGDTVLMDLLASADEVPMDPVRLVWSTRPWYEHVQPAGLWEFWERRERLEALGVGRFFTRADLKGWTGQPLTLAIASLSLAFHAEPMPGDASAFLLRGSAGCTPLVFLDGSRIRQGTEEEETFRLFAAGTRASQAGRGSSTLRRARPLTPIDHFISVSEIAAMEIYRGASDIPGEFRRESMGSRCGAVVVWSARGPLLEEGR